MFLSDFHLFSSLASLKILSSVLLVSKFSLVFTLKTFCNQSMPCLRLVFFLLFHLVVGVEESIVNAQLV
jgi:hypothetical protein